MESGNGRLVVCIGGLDSWDAHRERDCYLGAFEEAVELDANDMG